MLDNSPVILDSGPYFASERFDDVRRLPLPFHPIVYVNKEVEFSQKARELDDQRMTGNPAWVTQGEIRTVSLGQGLGNDPNLFVIPAVRDSQHQANFLGNAVESRHGRISLSSDWQLPTPTLFESSIVPGKPLKDMDGQPPATEPPAPPLADSREAAVTAREGDPGLAEQAAMVPSGTPEALPPPPERCAFHCAFLHPAVAWRRRAPALGRPHCSRRSIFHPSLIFTIPRTLIMHNHNNRKSALPGPRLLAVSALALALLSGCGSLQPVPYTEQEVQERVAQDHLQMYAEQEPIAGPITFHEAAARALKYNLDYKLKLMEDALTRSLHDVSTYEMLPRLVAGAGYVRRNNDSGGRSIGIEDRLETLRPSTSEERERTLANLTFSWNVLDFGVSYYRAQQKADQVLMAEERRRKVAQNVLQDVRNSYWRALGAQKLLGRVDALLARVQKALARAKEVEKQGLMPQPQVLAYERALLDAVNLLTLRRQDLELARSELTALMSVAPGTAYTLAEEKENALPPVPANLESLELMALEKRPEIMEEWYRKRVTENDIKAAKLLLWPNLSVDAGPQYDSNRYSYNNQWVDVGVRLSWNILKLTQWPSLQQAHEHQNKTDDMRRMALSMAVLTQVRVGVQRYGLSLAELEFAEESLRVDQRLLNFAQAAAKSQFDSELEVIRSEARALLAEYQRYAAYSNAQAAWGRVYNSVGLDVLPEAIESHDVKTLAAAMEKTMQQWQEVTFQQAPAPKTAAEG
ncbi:MAG: TolC family protein [Azovibrio sp.]|uniref:TolC family protein n=1 Tax=Azovibrio sp. TaxID=1872673 RepID=UPI003C7960EF